MKFLGSRGRPAARTPIGSFSGALAAGGAYVDSSTGLARGPWSVSSGR